MLEKYEQGEDGGTHEEDLTSSDKEDTPELDIGQRSPPLKFHKKPKPKGTTGSKNRSVLKLLEKL